MVHSTGELCHLSSASRGAPVCLCLWALLDGAAPPIAPSPTQTQEGPCAQLQGGTVRGNPRSRGLQVPLSVYSDPRALAYMTTFLETDSVL